MKKALQKHTFILLGWMFVLLGVIGIALPILPTTPFLILALALFSKSSPRFHQALLDSKWFGEILRQWNENKNVSRRIKYRATLLILLSFLISIAILQGKPLLQLLLVLIALICLFYIWRLKDPNEIQ